MRDPIDRQPDPQPLPVEKPVDGVQRDARAAGAEPIEIGRGGVGPQGEEEYHLWDYWRILRRRRWALVGVFLTAMAAAAGWIYTSRPVFTAAATLRIEKEAPRVLTFEEVVKADPQEDYYQTQFNILQSRSLANRVIEELGLDRRPEFVEESPREKWLAAAWAWIEEQAARFDRGGAPLPPELEEEEAVARESPITAAFLHRLRVEPIPETRLVRISFDSHSPELSARVVNALADAFIAYNLDHRTRATRSASQFLASQMEEARGKLEESEQKLNRFLKANGIHFLSSSGAGESQDLISQELAQLSDELLEARAERIARQSTLRQARSQDPETLPIVLSNPTIAKLKEQLLEMEVEYQQLGQVFKPGFRELRVRQLEENIRDLRQRIALETRKIVESLEADYRAALRTERQLEAATAAQRRLARQLGDEMVQYRLLRREVETNRELFSSLLGRFKETLVSSALLTSNISVVDRAKAPLAPSEPRKVRILFLGAFLGLFGGLGFAFFREYLDTTVKDAREVEATLGLPTLAVVPSWKAFEGRRARRATPFALVAHARVGSAFAEAFRSLRTSLLFSSPGRRPKTLMVTSIQLDDGKTSLATNLAIVLAQLGIGDVLLVDGDMRRPRLHELLGVPKAPGLSTFLAGEVSISDAVKATRIPNLYVLPSGEIPGNPAELMSSARVREGLDLVRQHFVHVIVDTPPLFGITDAMALAPQVDGVVLVLRRGRASREAAQRAVRALGSMQARLLGVILNDVEVRGADVEYMGYYTYWPGGRQARS